MVTTLVNANIRHSNIRIFGNANIRHSNIRIFGNANIRPAYARPACIKRAYARLSSDTE
ncbi:MAG: hypothetical protein ACXACY_27715 [Candidatus Hodarchaeales archaeon]